MASAANQTIAKTLGATPDIADILQRRESIFAPVRRKREAAEKELSEFEGIKTQQDIKEKKLLAGEQAAGLEEKRRTIEGAPEVQRLRDVESKLEMESGAFVPTKETAGDMAQLFALINIAGFSMGAGGKQNAQAAMAGMNGMMEGYQKGRADLYKKEKDIFETNFKKLTQTQKLLRERISDISQMADLTLSERTAKAKMAALEMNADFVAKYIDKAGLPRTIETLKEQERDLDKAYEIVRREQDKARERAEQRQFRADMARTRMTVGKKQLMQGNDGKMYAYDPETQQFSPVALPAGVETMAKPGSRAGQNALTFASRVYGNIENSAADLRNIIALPATSQLPILSGLLNVERDTALGSLQSMAARKITNAENRAFQQVSDQLGAALSRLEAQGLASGATKANIAAFNSLRPAAGDNAINMAIYLARVKQEIETGIKVHNKMPGATPEQKAATQVILDNLNNVVPFTVEDTLEVLRKSKNPLGDKMTRLIRQQPVADSLNLESSQQPAAATTGATPSVNVEAERSSARAAIAAGKDEAAVRDRFKQRTGQEL